MGLTADTALIDSVSRDLAACQFGISRAEWRLEADPEADPRPAIQALVKSQLGLHAVAQNPAFIAALETAPNTFETLELRRLVAHAAGTSADQVQQVIMAAVGCLQAWHAARAANNGRGDFSVVAEPFAHLISTQKSLAQVKAANLSQLYGRLVTPYGALLDNYDPGRRLDFVKQEFARLVPVCQALLRDETQVALPLSQNSERQQALIHALVTQLGYDAAPPRGKLGTSAHPFARRVGPREVWLTGRAEEAVLTTIMTMVHEGAHGRYYQGLPEARSADWSGLVASETMNEGMALLAEHLLGRRKSFAVWLAAQIQQQLGDKIDPVVLHGALNGRAATRRRTEASEVSYPLHLVLRTEIEERLFDGDLDPAWLPDAWAEASQRLLGFTPENDNEGCLQDIHLFAGYSGYFPCYLLGHMAAAQLWGALERAVPELDAQIAKGDFIAMNHWLREHIYLHGRTLQTDRLMADVSGSPFNATALIAHLQARYGEIGG